MDFYKRKVSMLKGNLEQLGTSIVQGQEQLGALEKIMSIKMEVNERQAAQAAAAATAADKS